MADVKPTTATAVKANANVQSKKSSNAISWIAPVVCILLGYIIWRFIFGSPDNFEKPDLNSWFWPNHHQLKPNVGLAKMYEGGIIVPILIGSFFIVVTFSIERFLTIKKAMGAGNINEFLRKIQFHLANKEVDKALAECDKQKGSVGNVMKSGLRTYKEMITNSELATEQKVLNIQKSIEESTALELPMLEKNLVFLSTLSSLATLLGLLGTVLGMIKAFSALGEDSGGANAAAQLSIGISEALFNTALGIGTSAVAIIMYNVFTTKIDSLTFGIDESGFTLTQSFASLYK
ncbi:MAG: MotA/TolQ/ExbB proton channel family protein [Chitinophagaceae bacterium]|nr:MotA/TolQ/ExbB proton channel family protein [Chitinophagaceae bacterium]MCW5904118.1 MotA/TolQ/ExbB proton channel family protein [Chitinophagaceae bacterium]